LDLNLRRNIHAKFVTVVTRTKERCDKTMQISKFSPASTNGSTASATKVSPRLRDGKSLSLSEISMIDLNADYTGPKPDKRVIGKVESDPKNHMIG